MFTFEDGFQGIGSSCVLLCSLFLSEELQVRLANLL
jgi:hypothetical protein